MAEQLNTAGATQLAERPAQAGPAAPTTTTRTTPNNSHDPANTSAERAGSAASSSPSYGSAEGSVARGGSGGASTISVTGTKPIPFAAVSFVCGLVGLLVANLVLGPLAIVLGAMGLRADKNRRVRAVLGILLGVADIAVFLFLAAHSGAHHGSVSWNFFGN